MSRYYYRCADCLTVTVNRWINDAVQAALLHQARTDPVLAAALEER